MGRVSKVTMAQIVQELRSSAQPATGESDRWGPLPDTRTGTGLLSPDGRGFDRVEKTVAPNQAVTLLGSGALVAWDACGCGGYCGFDWLGIERRQALRRAGRPTVGGHARRGQWGAMSHWSCGDGTDLLLVENHVRWGHELA